MGFAGTPKQPWDTPKKHSISSFTSVCFFFSAQLDRTRIEFTLSALRDGFCTFRQVELWADFVEKLRCPKFALRIRNIVLPERPLADVVCKMVRSWEVVLPICHFSVGHRVFQQNPL
jgi:hypothetical protein